MVAGADRLGLAAKGPADVVADACVSAWIALFLDLLPQFPGVGAAFLPALIEVRLVVVEPGRTALPLTGEHLLRSRGAGEAQDRVEGHAELPGDGPLAVTGGEESVDGGVLGAGAFGEPVPCRPGRRRGRLRLFLRLLRLSRRGAQAAAVPVDALLGGFSQVVPEMPSVGDLEGLWGAAGGSFGEEGGPVTADIPSL